MKRHILESIRIVASNIGFVIILAIARIYIVQPGFLLFLCALILSFMVSTVAYGRLAAKVQSREHESYIRLFKRHWGNYLTVGVICYLPLPLLVVISMILDIQESRIIFTVAGFVISVLTIYVFPYVFLQNQNTMAIKKGIPFLVKNISYSAPLIILTLLIFLIKSIVYFRPQIFYILSLNIYTVFIGGFIQNIFTVFISLTVFVAACRILVERTSPEDSHVIAAGSD